jgi:ferrous iron transport protein A
LYKETKPVAKERILSMEKKLSETGTGETVVIKRFEEDTIFLKLMEMGCVPGELVTVDHIAPLGDPICIAVAGYTLSLRLNEAELIWVEAPAMVDLTAQQEG